MPRLPRVSVGDAIYHVINRSNGKVKIFKTDAEYKHFESLLLEGKELIGMRILGYCLMPNHWHLVLYPRSDKDISEFMRWVTTTHVRQRRVLTQTVGHGHLYQGTYKSFLVQNDTHLVDLIRYIEQNPLRAKLVQKAENWQWSSLYKRIKKDSKLLNALPTNLPSNYIVSVNDLLPKDKVELFRRSIEKGTPYGSDDWVSTTIKEYNLEGVLRNPGRPKKY